MTDRLIHALCYRDDREPLDDFPPRWRFDFEPCERTLAKHGEHQPHKEFEFNSHSDLR
jgi:hypothetical protein